LRPLNPKHKHKMKKILLVALGASLFMVPAQAQKQAGNEKNLEVHFAPLGGSPISIDGIRFRKFNAAGNAAWRVNLYIGMNSEEEITQQADATQSPAIPELKKTTSGMTIGINPGYEKHMAGNSRLSPYWGAELAFTMATSSEEEEMMDASNNNAVYTNTTDNSDGYTSFGLNLIAGCDFYFAQSIYMGAEFGWGFAMVSMSDIEYSTTLAGAPSIPNDKQGSSFTLAPNAVGQIRLGFLF
jgi:opacity protein-like surface antigen